LKKNGLKILLKNIILKFDVATMIYKIASLLLSVINLVALFFFIDGRYIHPGSKTISRHDMLLLLGIDAVFMLYFLFRKKVLHNK
jgi:hypothetical protein